MPDIEEGVLDSTSSESQDVALLEQEDQISSSPEPFIPEVKEGEEKEEKEPSERSEDEDKEKEKLDEEKEKDERAKLASPPYDRPSMQQLREAFPELFKKFPSLRDIYYREQEFTQIFPTVEDAKEAASNADSFNALSDKALSGDTEGLLGAIKAADENAFNKIAQNVLQTIYKMSPDVHWQATLPLLQNLVRSFYIEGQRKGNQNVVNSAEYLSDFIFGDIKIAKGERNLIPQESKEVSEERKQLESERAKFALDRYEGFSNSVISSSNSQLKSLVDEKGKIDPDGVFSDFIKDTIVAKVLQEVDNQLAADKTHMKYMLSLWNKARDAGYSDEWKSRIISAYLARAKSLVPAVRAKFVSEASGSSAKASERSNNIHEKTASRKSPGAGGRSSSEGRNSPLDAKSINWDRTSDLDILNDNITFRK